MQIINNTIKVVVILTFALQLVNSIIDIREFGALSHQDHLSAQFVNQKAISLAINKANNLN